MVRWPGHIPAGSTSDQAVVGSDIFTTVCTITKAPIPSDRPIDGTSLLPAFQNKTIERKIPLYWRCAIAPEPLKIAMRVGDYTILANPALSKFEMYNLKTDVKQTDDLSAKEADKFQAMKKTLIDLNTQIEKEGPDWWKGQEKAPKKKDVKKINELSRQDWLLPSIVRGGKLLGGNDDHADGKQNRRQHGEFRIESAQSPDFFHVIEEAEGATGIEGAVQDHAHVDRLGQDPVTNIDQPAQSGVDRGHVLFQGHEPMPAVVHPPAEQPERSRANDAGQGAAVHTASRTEKL